MSWNHLPSTEEIIAGNRCKVDQTELNILQLSVAQSNYAGFTGELGLLSVPGIKISLSTANRSHTGSTGAEAATENKLFTAAPVTI